MGIIQALEIGNQGEGKVNEFQRKYIINVLPKDKFQNSSTKSQINHKFQYPMTKMISAVVSK
jgi:hypothetical protein